MNRHHAIGINVAVNQYAYFNQCILDSLITRFRIIKQSEQHHSNNPAICVSFVCRKERDSIATISAGGHQMISKVKSIIYFCTRVMNVFVKKLKINTMQCFEAMFEFSHQKIKENKKSSFWMF